MEIKITSRHVYTPDEVKMYIEEKFEKMERFHRALQSLEVVLKAEDRQQQCEVILHIRNRDPEAVQVACDGVHEAIDVAVDKVERRLRRLKEKRESRRRSAVR